MLKEADADAVKLECGHHTVELTEHLVRLGIPVMAHLGLTPQRVKEVGYTRQATGREEAEEILDLAREHEAAGASRWCSNTSRPTSRPLTEAVDIPRSVLGPAVTATVRCSLSPTWSASRSPARRSPSSSATSR